MRFDFIAHRDCGKELLAEICRLKQQHWPYDLSEHLRWIDANLLPDDTHLVLFDEQDRLVAYLNLIDLNVTASDTQYKALGIGNVCVDKSSKGSGTGYLLIQIATWHIKQRNRIGMLLCKDPLVDFYRKCHWHLCGKEVRIKGESHICNIMSNRTSHFDNLTIDRNF